MTRTIRMKDIAGLKANATTAPYATTEPAKIGGVRGGGVSPDPTPQGVIFQTGFDDDPDFTNTMHTLSQTQSVAEGDILPNGFTHLYMSEEWAPDTGFPDNHNSIEILDSNIDKTIDGTGKSIVFWRESFSLGWNNWASDAQLIHYWEQELNEVYIEFFIRFSPNWWQRTGTGPWTSKMFRIGSYSGVGSIYNGFGGNVGPRFFWDYKRDDFGVRNVLGLFEGPHGAQGSVESGDGGSKNYTSMTVGRGKNGSDPQVPDLVNGGFLVDFGGATSHEQVFGTTDVWTKMAFHVKLNSAPGVADGTLTQWINDEQFWYDGAISWITDDPIVNPDQKMVGWNYFAIGGNDYFQGQPNEERFEDWWAAENITVRDSIPEGLL